MKRNELDKNSGIFSEILKNGVEVGLELFGAMPLLKFSGAPDRNPARFLDAICLGYVIWWVPRDVDRKLMRLRFFSFLNRLGKHSLQVFVFSLVITFGTGVASKYWEEALPGSIRLVLVSMIVLSLAIPARLHELYREPRFQGEAGPFSIRRFCRVSPQLCSEEQ